MTSFLQEESCLRVQTEAVSNYLMKKYGIIKTCSFSKDAQGNFKAPDGYLNYCNTEAENLTASECLTKALDDNTLSSNGALKCDETTHSSDPMHPVRIVCSEPGEDFQFLGCYPKDDPNSIVLEGAYDPTDTQLAERIIETRAYYHFDPSDAGSITEEDVSGEK